MDRHIKWINSREVADNFVRNWMEMMETGTSRLIANVETEVRCLAIANKWFLPVTINNTEWDNSYVVSPYNAFVPYAREELNAKVKNPFIVAVLTFIIKLLGAYLRYTEVNKVIHVNNFVLSTNPYNSWKGEYLDELKSFLTREYPGHLIIFRSLNELQHTELLNEMRNACFINIVSRQVYLYKPDYKKWKGHKNNDHDRRIIRKQGLIHINHHEMKPYLPEALELYNLLYLRKYSKHNPQFTLAYFIESYERGLIHFEGYKDGGGKLKAFCGLFVYGNTITSPLVGYQTTDPQKSGLYIHAIQLIFSYLFESGLLLNLSSGAANFKRLRGGEPHIEYSAIYSSHLPGKTRRMVRLLYLVSNKIGKPLLVKYEL